MESGINSKPNFLIVGAAKAGTTSLAMYLNNHSDVYIPKDKEMRFFVSNAVSRINKKDPILRRILEQSSLNEKEYFGLYNNSNCKLNGDASIHYLYHFNEAIPKIKRYLGDVPIIIMLREPVSRAISNWDYNKFDFLPFAQALKYESRRKQQHYNSFWFYKELGLYYNQVEAYLDNFTHVYISIFERFINSTEDEYRKILRFLDLNDDKSNVIFEKYNISNSFVPRLEILLRLFDVNPRLSLKIINRLPSGFKIRKSQLVDKKSIQDLKSFYEPEVDKIRRLLNDEILEWNK